MPIVPTVPQSPPRHRPRPQRLPEQASETESSSSSFQDNNEAFWHIRSVYSPPAPPSGSHCVLQNDLLCTFGGLQKECESLLFRIVPREAALQPSNRLLYLQTCQRLSTAPLQQVVEQLSTTPGQCMLVNLNVAGCPLSTPAAAALLPILQANADVMTALNLRNCGLRGAAWHTIADFLLRVELRRLETLEVSCNLLDDADAASLLTLAQTLPSLRRIGLVKNRISKRQSHVILAELHERQRRNVSPSKSSTRSGSPKNDFTTPTKQRTLSPDVGDYYLLSPKSRRSPVKEALENRSTYTTLPVPRPHQPGEAVRLPKLTKKEFFDAVVMYRGIMTKQTALVDLFVLHETQPAIFEVLRRQTSAIPNVDVVTLPRYLCACFPHHSPMDIMKAMAFYSEYSLTTPLRATTQEGLRADQHSEIQRIFSCLDKGKTGILPLSVLSPPRASEGELEGIKAMLERMHISQLDFESFATIVAPYLAEARKRRRMR